MKVIQTSQAPQAIGCYSQAIQAGGFVFLSGQIALDPTTQNMVSDEIEAQLEQVFSNLQAVLFAANATFNDVVKLTVYLKDLGHFDLINQAMKRYFKMPYPARSAVQVVELPKGALIEIEGIAFLAN